MQKETEKVSNLILDMAKTASILSNQLLKFHKLFKTSSGSNLTPNSSGYNSFKTSTSFLSFSMNESTREIRRIKSKKYFSQKKRSLVYKQLNFS